MQTISLKWVLSSQTQELNPIHFTYSLATSILLVISMISQMLRLLLLFRPSFRHMAVRIDPILSLQLTTRIFNTTLMLWECVKHPLTLPISMQSERKLLLGLSMQMMITDKLTMSLKIGFCINNYLTKPL